MDLICAENWEAVSLVCAQRDGYNCDSQCALLPDQLSHANDAVRKGVLFRQAPGRSATHSETMASEQRRGLTLPSVLRPSALHLALPHCCVTEPSLHVCWKLAGSLSPQAWSLIYIIRLSPVYTPIPAHDCRRNCSGYYSSG